jgi:hypothetical protein
VAFLDHLRENDWVKRAENIDFCISRPAAKEFLGGMSMRFRTKATMTPANARLAVGPRADSKRHLW